MTTPILEKLFAKIDDSKGLPALETTVATLVDSFSGKNIEQSKVARIVAEDFALTQKLLKLANSPMYAPFATETGSISSALKIVGADGLLHIVLGTSLVSESEVEADDGLAKTLLSSELARSACPDRLEEASIAALMYDLGGLLTEKYLPEEFAYVARDIAAGASSDAAEKEVLGMTLQQIGVEVAKHWNLPAGIISVIDGSGDQTLVQVAKFSSSASTLIRAGKSDEANQLVAKLDLPEAIKSKISGLVVRKGETIRAPLLKQLSASSEAGLDRLLATLSDEKRGTVEEVAAAMFPTFGSLLGTAHCLLFMSIKSGEMCVRYGYGKGIDELRSKLRISAEFKPTAFHAAIKNNVDVSIADVSKLKPTALPDGYKQLLPQVTKFLILPIMTTRVSGLVYCDWESDKELNREELVAVKRLRDLFLPFFPH